MKIIKEAVLGEYHFILDDNYFCVTLDGEEMVNINRSELSELVNWLKNELGETQPVNEARTPTPKKEAPVVQLELFGGGPDPMSDRRAHKAEHGIDRSGVDVTDLGSKVEVISPKHIRLNAL